MSSGTIVPMTSHPIVAFPPHLARPGHGGPAVRTRAGPRRAPARDDAPRHARRARPAARAHAGGDRRHRRPLPAHERTAVDRRPGRLRGRVPPARGPLRPVHRRSRPDADDRRPRPGRRLPPHVVARRPRRQGGPAGQEGRGAPADPRAATALLPGPRRGRGHRGRRSPAEGRSAELELGAVRLGVGLRRRSSRIISTASSGSSVTCSSARSASATVPCGEQRAADPVEQARPSTRGRPARPGSGGPCRSG